jgi:gas vesicle protein
MAEKSIFYFLVGLGVGSLIGILYAPKSGEETRNHLVQKAKEASEYAQKKGRELTESAENLMERGKESMTHKKERITTAIHAGREAYHREENSRVSD